MEGIRTKDKEVLFVTCIVYAIGLLFHSPSVLDFHFWCLVCHRMAVTHLSTMSIASGMCFLHRNSMFA